MHTPLCRHAVGEPEEYAARATALGLSEIGFSDHSPMPRDDFDDWRMFDRQLDEYVEKVARARRRFPQLTIRLALEVDYLPGHEDWIRALAARHPWDYFIGSVHYVDDRWDVDNPHKLAEWHKRDVDTVWMIYVERLTQSAASGLFDIIGHCDLPKKFGHRAAIDLRPQYQKFLETAAVHGVAIELNTAGWRKDCRELYPSRTILELAFAAGVSITFGSDAHVPVEVGADFGKAITLAKEAGYTQSCRFSGREKELVQL
jgi:histidinol-phosphatase (PHP family)